MICYGGTVKDGVRDDEMSNRYKENILTVYLPSPQSSAWSRATAAVRSGRNVGYAIKSLELSVLFNSSLLPHITVA